MKEQMQRDRPDGGVLVTAALERRDGGTQKQLCNIASNVIRNLAQAKSKSPFNKA